MNRRERRARAKIRDTGPMGASFGASTAEPRGDLASQFTQVVTFYRAGRTTEANRLCVHILQHDPDHIGALHLAGLIAIRLDRAAAAVGPLLRAIRLNDRLPDLQSAAAEAFQRLGQFDTALSHYHRALALDPYDAETWYDCGNTLLKLGRYEEAIGSYDRTLAIRPKLAQALNNRGDALFKLGRVSEALASCDGALRISPNFVDALYNRGILLTSLKRLDEAIASFTQALAIKPDFTAALNSRGNILSELGRYDDAVKDFERVLSVQPRRDFAQGALLAARLLCCDWQDYDVSVARLEQHIKCGKRVAVPFLSLYTSSSPQVQLECARTFSKQRPLKPEKMLWAGEAYKHRKIHVAYLSANFCQHALGSLIIGPIEQHDRSRFAVTGISYGPDSDDELRARFLRSFDHFIDVRHLTDYQAACLLREKEIDIAIDLMGYTLDARPEILAYRPAPIQVNYLGYPGTMGVDYIDYIIADRIVIPESEKASYSERIVYLPHSYQANDQKRVINFCTPERSEAGLPDTGFVFCSFNQHYKITPTIFDIWMRLLQHVEGSVLWLLQGDAAVVANLRREAEKRGVAAGRLIFAPRVRPADHLARYRLADLLLDTLPYGAHTTASDALWAGVPVVTCRGTSFAGRVAASLLTAIGLPELIGENPTEYEALALRLATKAAEHTATKAKLAENGTKFPLFDTGRCCSHIESAFDTMWQRLRSGMRPESFAVVPNTS